MNGVVATGTINALFSQRFVHGLDDIVAHPELPKGRLSIFGDDSLRGADVRG